MQFVRLNDVTHHYQLFGSPLSRQLIVFINSLGTDFRIWRDVVIRLAGDYAVLTYDFRGHGLSETGQAPYSMPMLAADLAALIDHIGTRQAIICGVSVGGLIGQQLYADRPDLVRSLVLCDTLGKIGDDAFWDRRMSTVRDKGLVGAADGILERWFTREFRDVGNPDYVGYRTMLGRQPLEGYLATCEALRHADLRDAARKIDVPTLCVVGDQDGSTPARAVADFAKTIPLARFELLTDCGHIPSIEQPEKLAAIIRAFMSFVATETASHVSH